MPKIPTQVSFRNMDKPLGMEERIIEKVEALERFHPRITGCRVMVERRHHNHWKGDHFHVSINLTIPGAELVANREPAQNGAHEELPVAVHDAFDEIRRQLETHIGRQRAIAAN